MAVWAESADIELTFDRSSSTHLSLATMPAVRKLARLLAREDQLWSKAVKVSQLFLEFPAELFERVLSELLPSLSEAGLRWLGA